jgi:hypothetical protein
MHDSEKSALRFEELSGQVLARRGPLTKISRHENTGGLSDESGLETFDIWSIGGFGTILGIFSRARE